MMGDEARFGNYSCCCRLCLSEQFESLKPIFEGADENNEDGPFLVQQIQSFLGIEIVQGDKLSTMICDLCRQKIHGFQEYKKSCSENQRKLQNLLSTWDPTGESNSNMVIIKEEPSEIEDYYDEPPILSPQHRPIEEDTLASTTEMNVLSSQEEVSQHSIDSQISQNGSIPPSLDSEADLSESDVQKIQFAAGLRLKSKSLTNNCDASKADLSLTKIEEAYIEKNKALVSMLYSSYCACHNFNYNTAKRLYGHLRANYNWVPVFTCYNCLITFTSRAALMTHGRRCPKPFLENCIRLAQVKKRLDNRTRLYQFYRCGMCDLNFAFYDDYENHLHQDHAVAEYCKWCSKVFTTKEEATKHLFESCNLHYFCDICYTAFETLDKFKEHCEIDHDKNDNYVFVEYHKEFKLVDPLEILRSRKRKYPETEPDPQIDLINPAKKMKSIKLEKARRVDEISEDDLDIDDVYQNDSSNTSYNLRSPTLKTPRKYGKYKFNGWKTEPSKCEKCDREFSTYYNMVRHMKTHEESEKHLQCSFCPEKFRLVSELKEHLNITHGEAHICSDCGKQFETFKQLDQHRFIHLNIKVYRDSETSSYRVTNPRYQCEECDSAFETEPLLKQHLSKHYVVVKREPDIGRPRSEDGFESSSSKRLKHSCEDCNRHYLSAKGLWLHNKRHHPNRTVPQQSYKCDICDKVCSTNAAYHSHRAMHFRHSAKNKTELQKDPKAVEEQNDEDDDYFTCKRCFKVFSTKYNLKTHLKTHGVNIAGGRSVSKTGKSTKTFWCDICHQACQGYQELQKHKQEHVNENLGDTESIEDDVDIKPNLKTCELCSRIFITQLGYIKHKQKHEKVDNLNAAPIKKAGCFYFCKYCKIPFSSTNALCDHMLEEHDEVIKQNKPKQQHAKKYDCNICNKSFVSSNALCSHQGWHKRTNNLNSPLNYALKPQPKGYNINENHHQQLQQPTNPKLLREIKEEPQQQPTVMPFKARNTCKVCGLSFSTDTALQIHVLEVHRNVNATLITPKCTTCQIEFATNEAFDEHQKLHALPPQLLFKCKYCPKMFPKCNAFNMHINTFHPQYNTVGKIKCHECNRFFEKQNALAMHLKVHDRQKMSMGATQPMKQETTPKPATKLFTCSICFASFTIAKDLRNHIIATHPF
ncbi:zinc finger protein 62 homolog isoform X2 [Onthophagus taurus]|uniref:zinc finger protein 62 homolog isoform X2 n=1 Tax=Onthophagus taurus TaxID=166361 RepID=UPI000C20F59B|nr:zinc finger protein 624-like isoform X2 [Onthophagus taurus]